MKTNIRAEFKSFNTNAKGDVSIALVIKGDLDDQQILALHRLKAEGVVFADLFNGQADMEDYAHDDETSEGPHKGVGYSVDQDGTAQLTIDDAVVDTSYIVVDENGNETVENADGEPSEDEKEIESMEKEVYQEEREKEVMPDDLPF